MGPVMGPKSFLLHIWRDTPGSSELARPALSRRVSRFAIEARSAARTVPIVSDITCPSGNPAYPRACSPWWSRSWSSLALSPRESVFLCPRVSVASVVEEAPVPSVAVAAVAGFPATYRRGDQVYPLGSN